jgi:hypothetical protein
VVWAASNLAEYEAIAYNLVTNRAFAEGVRARIAAQRLRAPLFNTVRWTHAFETGLTVRRCHLLAQTGLTECAAVQMAWDVWQGHRSTAHHLIVRDAGSTGGSTLAAPVAIAEDAYA